MVSIQNASFISEKMNSLSDCPNQKYSEQNCAAIGHLIRDTTFLSIYPYPYYLEKM